MESKVASSNMFDVLERIEGMDTMDHDIIMHGYNLGMPNFSTLELVLEMSSSNYNIDGGPLRKIVQVLGGVCVNQLYS